MSIRASGFKSVGSLIVTKNSALGEDLDWERNVKPPPVITEVVS
ncbi:hypothetical protein HanXRQr2_Chr01g0030751 [Helianthus annuus]|uniref:Uncharacterized protein n=1 Tax=Helianthus annuus TaxID=4232 RepID=A0A9K3JWI8_HELAN|nr:hypothetical protein HanXRQr2_Chr01g0030751 [Helianthus annuus]